MLSDEIYCAVSLRSDRNSQLAHGFTSSGHPVAAAVALETIRIIEEDNLVHNSRIVGEYLLSRLNELADMPIVANIRGLGLIAAVELKSPSALPIGVLGKFVFERAHCHGLVIRNLGDTIALCPPLITKREDIDEIVRRLNDTLNEALAFVYSVDPES